MLHVKRILLCVFVFLSDKAWNLLQNTTRMAVEHASQANEAHEEKNQLSSNMQEKSTQTDRLVRKSI